MFTMYQKKGLTSSSKTKITTTGPGGAFVTRLPGKEDSKAMSGLTLAGHYEVKGKNDRKTHLLSSSAFLWLLLRATCRHTISFEQGS